MATTPRSRPREDCTACKGFGIISLSKDPDEVADCVCTDPVDVGPDDVQFCPTNVSTFAYVAGERQRLQGVIALRIQEVKADV